MRSSSSDFSSTEEPSCGPTARTLRLRRSTRWGGGVIGQAGVREGRGDVGRVLAESRLARDCAADAEYGARGTHQDAHIVTGRPLTATPEDSELMTEAAKKLLEEFDALPERDQAEVLAELLRRVPATPHDLRDPEDLVGAADRLFVELDRREQRR